MTELGQGEVKYLPTEVVSAFTGNFLAFYASGNKQVSQELITVEWFTYQ